MKTILVKFLTEFTLTVEEFINEWPLLKVEQKYIRDKCVKHESIYIYIYTLLLKIFVVITALECSMGRVIYR